MKKLLAKLFLLTSVFVYSQDARLDFDYSISNPTVGDTITVNIKAVDINSSTPSLIQFDLQYNNQLVTKISNTFTVLSNNTNSTAQTALSEFTGYKWSDGNETSTNLSALYTGWNSNSIGYSNWINLEYTTPYSAPYCGHFNGETLIDKFAINLSWGTPNLGGLDLLNYQLQVFNTSKILDIILDKNLINYNIDLLDSATNYRLQLRCSNRLGLSEWQILECKTLDSVPYWKSDLVKAVVIGDFSIKLDWIVPYNGGAHIDLYKLKLGDEVIETNNITYTFNNLVPFSEYQITVYAHNIYGYSEGKSVTYKTLASVPYWNTGDIFSVLSRDNSSITIKWLLPVSDILYYRIGLYHTNGIEISQTNTDNNQITLTGLDYNINYMIKLIATNTIGDSNEKEWVFSMIRILPSWDDMDVCSFRDVTSTSITVDRKAANGHGIEIIGYDVIYKDIEYIDKYDGLSYIFSNLTPFTGYRFKVRGYSLVGTTDWIESLEIKTLPDKPLWLVNTIFNILDINITEIKLSWLPPYYSGSLVYYNIKILENSYEYKLINGYDKTELEIDNLKSNNLYQFFVQAYNTYGSTDWKSSDTITTNDGIPRWNSNEVLSYQVTDKSIELLWDYPNDGGNKIVGYKLKLGYAVSELVNQEIVTELGGEIKGYVYRVGVIESYSKYIVSIMAYNAFGSTEWRSIEVITLAGNPGCSGISWSILDFLPA